MSMNFRTWFEDEASLGGGIPRLTPQVNKGNSTVASDEVLRTGLQPQVGAEEIRTHQKDEQDKVLAIDGAIKRADEEMPQGKQENQSLNKFKKMWDELKKKWDAIKMGEDEEDPQDDSALGSVTGDKDYLQKMQQHPNMIPTGPEQAPLGPSLGVS